MARTPGSHNQGIRLIRLLRRLQGRHTGMRLTELEKEFGISRSQLRRDLLALEEAGTRLDLEQEHGRYGHGRVRLLAADANHILVTESERYALLAARGFFDAFRGSDLHRNMKHLFEKLMDTMPVSEKRHTRSLATKIFYRPSGGTKTYEDENTQDILDALLTGVIKQRRAQYTYRPRSGRKSSGVMCPYAVVIHRNGLYVVAQRTADANGNEITQEPRVFAVERFLEARWLRRTSFDYPEDLDMEDYFDGAFGLITGTETHHVVVELDKSVITEARSRKWHRTQITTPLSRGRTRIEFDVTSLREVVTWVLGWGPAAQVIEPDPLRERVRAALRETLARY